MRWRYCGAPRTTSAPSCARFCRRKSTSARQRGRIDDKFMPFVASAGVSASRGPFYRCGSPEPLKQAARRARAISGGGGSYDEVSAGCCDSPAAMSRVAPYAPDCRRRRASSGAETTHGARHDGKNSTKRYYFASIIFDSGDFTSRNI